MSVVYTRQSSSPSSPYSHFRQWCPYVCSLRLCLYFCFASKIDSFKPFSSGGWWGVVCTTPLGVCAGPQMWVNQESCPRHPTWRHPPNKDFKCCVGAPGTFQTETPGFSPPPPRQLVSLCRTTGVKGLWKRKGSSAEGTFSPDGQRG